RVERPAGEVGVGRLQDRAVVLERRLVRPPLDRPGDGVGLALQRGRDHPVDGREEQHGEHAEEYEARDVAPARTALAPVDARAQRGGRARRRAGGRDGRRAVRRGPGAHALPLPRSRSVRRNWKPVTTRSSAPHISDIAAAGLNWKRGNASSGRNNITPWGVRSGPPAVMRGGGPRSGTDAFVVVTVANGVAGLSWGQVT